MSLHEVCLRIVDGATLEEKLRALPEAIDDVALAERRGAPARAPAIALAAGSGPLPRPYELADPAARAACLARFAHHELMAVELFAWALLRWPGLPPALRRAFVRILTDEQRHCRMYLERLAAHGSALEEHRCSGYLLRHLPAIDASPHGPRAFLAAVGLTFEQANLDFAPLYAEAFRRAGDEASARVCERVHTDEIRHVAVAARWLPLLAGPGHTDLSSYRQATPFPLGAARAKGRRFDAAARRAAGLSDALIEHVRTARSSQEAAPRPREPGA